MSNILSALRELELRKRATRSEANLETEPETASEIAALKQFTSAREPEDRPQPATANRPQLRLATITVAADEFSALENRVVRVVETVKRERQFRVAAEERALLAEAEASAHLERVSDVEREMRALAIESDARHQRVRNMVSLLDSLEADPE